MGESGMTNEAQVEAALQAYWQDYDRPAHGYDKSTRDRMRRALEAAEAAPKLDPFPFTYPYKGLLSDGRGRQGMTYVSAVDVREGIRFEPREKYSQKLEHYVGTANAAEYYRALERTR